MKVTVKRDKYKKLEKVTIETTEAKEWGTLSLALNYMAERYINNGMDKEDIDDVLKMILELSGDDLIPVNNMFPSVRKYYQENYAK